ncbi:MAG: hypothetical protein VYC50_03965 [Pseudomonadota bacterium]|nr:hypothetical protein [Pseudomonadota bacterium]
MMKSKNLNVFFSLVVLLFSLNQALSQSLFSIKNQKNLIKEIRDASYVIKGEMPVAINYSKLAESHRPYSDIITDGNNDIFIQARTAFQIVYPSSEIMIDGGMDRSIHNYFGFGRAEPYWENKNNEIKAALKRAAIIITTHEHADHIAGIINSNITNSIASKTLLTKSQVETLVNNPQMPAIKLSPDDIKNFNIIDYESIMPLAPGVVLIKSAGHTNGHQMIFVSLENKQEFLFIGDVAWSIENIKQLKLRPLATRNRIKEDSNALMNQMVWIKYLMDEENIIIVPSHDDKLIQEYKENSIINDSLKIN